MPNLPTPIRAALGLAATAVDEARKLPETLPQAVSTVPLRAVSTAMQASLKLQQHLATLSARGDEVLSQLRGHSAEPPTWATFDDSPAHTGAVDPRAGEPGKAAFDRIDYDSTGFADSAADEDGRDRWDAVGVGGAPDADLTSPDELDLDLPAPGSADGVTAPPPNAAEPVPPAPTLADAVSNPDVPHLGSAGQGSREGREEGRAGQGSGQGSQGRPDRDRRRQGRTGQGQAGRTQGRAARGGGQQGALRRHPDPVHDGRGDPARPPGRHRVTPAGRQTERDR